MGFAVIDKEEMLNMLKKRKIEAGLINRVMKTYTRSKKSVVEKVITKDRLRAFNIYLNDMKTVMGEVNEGGVVVRRITILTISYADNILLLGTSMEVLQDMTKKLEIYQKIKKMVLNIDKTKVMKFRK